MKQGIKRTECYYYYVIISGSIPVFIPTGILQSNPTACMSEVTDIYFKEKSHQTGKYCTELKSTSLFPIKYNVNNLGKIIT